jgi:taurine dioxygenase
MGYQTIEVRNSAPHIGAEIRGVDLSNPLGNQQFQEVHDALMDRLVIFFRDQKLSIEQHKDFARRFGKLHMHPASPDVVADHPEVLVIKADDKAKYIPGEDWHSDVSCDPEPPMGSILYLTEVPPDGGGDTMFANMYLAYEMLSEPIRKLISGLTAIHDGEKHYRGRYGNDDRGRVYPRAEHPIVRTHPEGVIACGNEQQVGRGISQDRRERESDQERDGHGDGRKRVPKRLPPDKKPMLESA